MVHRLTHSAPVRALAGKQPHLLAAGAVAAVNQRPRFLTGPGAERLGGFTV